MGWDGNGNYTRVHNFSADASAGIKILAARMDAEIDDVASAFTRVWTRDGQNVPTTDLPMGGRKFVNVGAPTSVNNFMRAREFIENVPIFMQDAESSADRVSVSAQYFTSVSANQAPGDGTKILVRVASNKSSAVLYLNGHSANIEFQNGNRAAQAMVSGGIYEMIYSSVDTAWKMTSPNPDPGNVLHYGANAVPGTTDMTAAIQAAINYGAATGTRVFLPAGRYRITAPLVFATGNTIKFTFEGESSHQTVIYADFTSGAATAALLLNNTSGTRAYVAFKNFQLEGVDAANVSGIYCNFTSSLTELVNLYIWKFYNGIVLANDFYTKFVNCQVNFNNNDGVKTGYLIDGTTSAPCFNLGFFGCDFSFNAGAGVHIAGCESLAFSQTASEGNETYQFRLETVEGVDFSGCYMEHANTDPGSPVAQLYLLNCNGVCVNGLTASAFKQDGSPIIFMDGCIGVNISGFVCRTATGPLNAIGIRINSCFGVSINSSFLSDVATGIYLDGQSRVSLNDTGFANTTTRINSPTAAAHKLYWNQAVASDLAASTFDAADSVDVWFIDNAKNKVGETQAFSVSVSVAELNAGGKDIITATFPGERWRIIDIIFLNGTPLDAGGDRLLQVTDTAAVYTSITAANLKAAAASNRWGSTVVPMPANTDVHTVTGTGLDLVAKYSGGTANYASGAVNIVVTAMRVA